MAPSFAAGLGAIASPLDWVNAAVVATRDAIPSAYEKSGLSYSAEKSELRPGDHVYAWKLGYTYSHHGVVVRTESCRPSCKHESLSCCSIVHFRPPEGESPGRIELVSAAGFAAGRQVCRVRYGVNHTEFYLRRSGCCTTETTDPWPIAALRALSLLEPSGGSDSGAAAAPEGESNEAQAPSSAAQVEYDLLKKNSELLARWCQLGEASGVHRFRSAETAPSLQTHPGRFVRLGVAVAAGSAAAVGAAAAAAAAASASASASATAGAAAASAASAGASAGAATTTTAASAATAAATAGGGAASAATAATGEAAAAATSAATAATTAAGGSGAWAHVSSFASAFASDALVAGSLAASAAGRSLLQDAMKRPTRAVGLAREVVHTIPPPTAPGLQQQRSRLRTFEGQRRYAEEQDEAIVAALRDCLAHLGVNVPKALNPLLEDPVACCRLCEMLVDILEARRPQVPAECAAVVQRFIDELLS